MLTLNKQISNYIKIFGLILLSVSCTNSAKHAMDTSDISKKNPAYFEINGKPTILISLSENCAAFINRKFDYKTYFKVLHNNGLNVVNIFSEVYLEPSGDSIHEDFVLPWKRSDKPGYKFGGNKFDLSLWDDKYFEGLEQFVSAANAKNIIVKYIFLPRFLTNISGLQALLHL